MLGFIRKKTKGLFLWVIVVIIIIPFALFGINQYFINDGEFTVATVGEQKVPYDRYLSLFRQEQRRLQERLGSELDEKTREQLSQSVINRLVSQALQEELAKKNNLITTDEELKKYLVNIEAFQQDGAFSREQYIRFLTANRYSSQRFETEQKQQLANEQIRNIINNSYYLDDKQKNKIINLIFQMRKFDYIELNIEDLADNVTFTFAEIQKYYDDNKAEFIEPQKAKIQYVELNLDDIKKTITIGQEDIQQNYNERKEQSDLRKQIKASHILLEDEKIAKEVLDSIRKGESFEKLAKEFSIDEGSKDTGGDLGYFGKNIMAKEFEDAAFSLEKVNQISDIVKTDFGYHIIKLTEIKNNLLASFDKEKNSIKDLLLLQKAVIIFEKQRQQLADISFDNINSLEEVVKQISLTLKHSDWIYNRPTDNTKEFDKNSLVTNRDVIKEVFSNDVLNKGNNSNIIELSPDHVVVARVIKKENEYQKTLKESSTTIKNNIRIEKAEKNAQQIISLITDALNSQEENNKFKVDILMSEYKLKWQSMDFIDRFNSKEIENIDPSLLQFAFRSKKNINDEKVYQNGIDPNNKAYIIAITDVRNPSKDELEANSRAKQVVDTIIERESNLTYLSALRILQNNTDIRIEDLNNITSPYR